MKAVGDPAANLRRSEPPFIHQPMEGMPIMIAFLADGPQLRGEGRPIPEFAVFVGHRAPSPQSQLDFQPIIADFDACRRTALCSGESSFKIGFVLLMWT